MAARIRHLLGGPASVLMVVLMLAGCLFLWIGVPLAWMWIGFGGGVAISLPVYLFYTGGDHDPRRGLIFQGTAATLGLVAGAVFTMDSRDTAATPSRGGLAAQRPASFQVTGGGLMPVPGGMGFTVSGLLF